MCGWIQSIQTGGQTYNDTSPVGKWVFSALPHQKLASNEVLEIKKHFLADLHEPVDGIV